jgi:hypothetical protein
LYASSHHHIQRLAPAVHQLTFFIIITFIIAIFNHHQSERKQKQLACALFEHTVRFAGLNSKSASLAANLFNMAKKCGATPGELRTYLVPLRSAPASTPAADLHAKLASIVS